MGTADNKELIRNFGQAGGLEAVFASCADDVRWTVTGTTKYSGTFEGKQELMEKLFGPIFAEMATFGTLSIDNVIAEDDYVVAQAHASGRMTKSGKPYDNTYCMVFRFVDDKIQEITEYNDTELITEAFGH